MSNSLNNIREARSIYFTSLFSGPERSLTSSARAISDVEKYDEYLDTVVQYHLEKKMKIAAFESKKNLSKEKKRSHDEKLFKMVKKNITLYETKKSELDHFINSLNEHDEWEANEADLIERLKSTTSSECDSPDEMPQKEVDQIVMKTKAKAEKIEELSRSLLMGVDLDYLQNEDDCCILLQFNFS